MRTMTELRPFTVNVSIENRYAMLSCTVRAFDADNAKEQVLTFLGAARKYPEPFLVSASSNLSGVLGITTVALNEEGELTEYRPDGTSGPAK